jgi:hypothetical protein
MGFLAMLCEFIQIVLGGIMGILLALLVVALVLPDHQFILFLKPYCEMLRALLG